MGSLLIVLPGGGLLMGAKGSNKFCCCDGCSAPPIEQSGQGQFLVGQATTSRLCCSCIPLQLCAIYETGTKGYPDYRIHSTLVTLGQGCAAGVATADWTGTLPIDGEVAHIILSLTPDPYTESCSVCLSCYEIGVTNQCILITDEIRNSLCSTCQGEAFSTNDIRPVLVYNLTDHLYGPATLTFTRALNTSLIPRPFRDGAISPCWELAYQISDPYGLACGAPCGGCGCICTYAQIAIVLGNNVEYINLTFCNGAYSNIDGWYVAITPTGGGCCALQIISHGDLNIIGSTGGAVGIGSALNPCPNPVAEWTFAVANRDSSDTPIIAFAYFYCVGCDGSSLGITDGGGECCPNPIPRQLQCEVKFSPFCLPCALGGPVDEIFTLNYSVHNPGWKGTWDAGIHCDPPPPPDHLPTFFDRVTVTVGCSGGKMSCRLQVFSLFIDVTTAGGDYAEIIQCDPPDYTFEFHGTFTWTGSNGPCGIHSVSPAVVTEGWGCIVKVLG